MKSIVLDIDNTICTTINSDYKNSIPNIEVIEKINLYKNEGFKIVLYTSRNMRTYEGSIGKINKNTIPILVEWLLKHNVLYDELIVGKPWCGNSGFYVDDRAIRPNEFLSMNFKEITELLK
jgi:capsule biosynthesis phosphatase